MSDEVLVRLNALEARIALLEQRGTRVPAEERPPSPEAQKIFAESPFAGEPAHDFGVATAKPGERSPDAAAHAASSPQPSGVTQILGYGGALAVIVAAVYVISLAIGSGWLTPVRQLMAVVLAGIAMVFFGVVMKGSGKAYAGSLPGTGVVLLYLAVFGGHGYYGLISAPVAFASLALVTFLGLGLGRVFASDMLAFIAVFGTYLGPMLIRDASMSAAALFGYFSLWGVLFCSYGIIVGKRVFYIAALYLGLTSFHFLTNEAVAWRWILGFQLAQFAVFGMGATLYSTRRRKPLTATEAAAHFPSLIVFYFIQYDVISRNAPGLLLALSLGSALVLMGLVKFVEMSLSRESKYGHMMAMSYIGLVLFHAVFLMSTPAAIRPWVGVLIGPLCLALIASYRNWRRYMPLLVTGALVMAVGGMETIAALDGNIDLSMKVLPLFYCLSFYGAFLGVWSSAVPKNVLLGSLYVGHIFGMVAVVRILDHRLGISIIWGLMALIWMVVAVNKKQKFIAQSALLILGVASAKVMFYDLSDATALVRIGCLLVLGGTLFGGGWLYQKIESA